MLDQSLEEVENVRRVKRDTRPTHAKELKATIGGRCLPQTSPCERGPDQVFIPVHVHTFQ